MLRKNLTRKQKMIVLGIAVAIILTFGVALYLASNQEVGEPIDSRGPDSQVSVENGEIAEIEGQEKQGLANKQETPKKDEPSIKKTNTSQKNEATDKKPSKDNPPNETTAPPTTDGSNTGKPSEEEKPVEAEKEKVWVEDPPKMVKGKRITYESPDKAPSLNWMKANGVYLLRHQDGRLELYQGEKLIGVDVEKGDVGRVTLWDQKTTIWLWGGYTAAYLWTEEHPDILYASFGNNAVDYDICGIVQSYTPVTWEPQGHWEYK